jgi:transglutaminase-like putative cysteine protease
VYLRGAALTRYHSGRWSFHQEEGDENTEFLPVVQPPTEKGLVRQRITIEPTGRSELFCVWPFFNRKGSQRLFVDRRRDALFCVDREMNNAFTYELATLAFQGGLQTSLVPVPADRPVDPRLLLQMPTFEGKSTLPKLTALAEKWTREAEIEPDDHSGCARLLERRLRNSGRFTYSLEGQNRNLAVDPVEDFIASHPRGHCEYFATALVLMLRSRGIPARLVVGYKTNEWNRMERFFQVRQLHAHTWVEAYMGPGHVQSPEASDPDGEAIRSGGWLRLDPTPAAPGPGVNVVLDAIGRTFDWLDVAWASYVVEMDHSRQHESVYDPLIRVMDSIKKRLTDPEWWRGIFGSIAGGLRSGLESLVNGQWFSWRGGLAAMVLAGLLVLAYRLFRIVLRRLLRLAARTRRLVGAAAAVEFYRRLETVLARFGLTRPAHQTQREFAHRAGTKIAISTGQAHLADLPGEIAEAFYYVRFGGAALDNHRSEAVEQALGQLEASLSRRQWAVGRG